MATTVSLVQDVSVGIKEYVASREINALNDTLEVQFNRSMTIEQLSIKTSLSYKVWLIFPGTGAKLTVLNTVGARSINQATGGRGQMWYRLPARATVRVEIDQTPTPEVLTMSIVGDSGF